MLKEKLIHSIEALLENAKEPERINRLILSIKDKDSISDAPLDYWKALYLIFVIYVSWPEVETDPNNKQLIALGKECAKKAKPLLSTVKAYLHEDIDQATFRRK